MTDICPSPIFLHGLWRSGSTYAWSRFRAAPGVRAFFEPLYPGLRRLTAARIGDRGWRDAAADNRHHDLAAPYYAEYASLLGIGGRGVRGLKRSFAFDRFALASGAPHAALEAYVARLIDHAAGVGERAVLGCNRTTLRMGWLRERFGGYHLYVERHPLAIWKSYARHAADGNNSYFTNLQRIVERNAADPLFAPWARRLWLRRGLARLRKPARVYPRAFAEVSAQDSYGLVYHLWLLGALHALGSADAVLDTCLAGRPGYAAEMERRVERGAGLAVDFSGLRRAPDCAAPEPFGRAEVERAVLEALPPEAAALLGDPVRARARLHMLAPAKADVVCEAIARLTGPRARKDVRRPLKPAAELPPAPTPAWARWPGPEGRAAARLAPVG